MPLEHEMAEFLGILRLDTKSDQRWWLMTRKSLIALSEACAKYAEELQDAD